MCEVMHVSISGYYAWLKREVSKREIIDSELSRKIVDIYELSKRRYGSVRIHKELQHRGEMVGRKRVIRLMKRNNICAVGKRKFKATTDSQHHHGIAENKLNQIFNVEYANKIWVSDITYIATGEGWLYLAVVIDLYSRKIIGWSMDKRMTRELIINALLMAYWQRKPAGGVIFHSDRGSQYASKGFQNLLVKLGVYSSMSGKGNCFDNAVAESFFHSLKVELIYTIRFLTRDAARAEIFNYIEVFYNRVRLHSTLGYYSPEVFEQQAGMVKVA